MEPDHLRVCRFKSKKRGAIGSYGQLRDGISNVVGADLGEFAGGLIDHKNRKIVASGNRGVKELVVGGDHDRTSRRRQVEGRTGDRVNEGAIPGASETEDAIAGVLQEEGPLAVCGDLQLLRRCRGILLSWTGQRTLSAHLKYLEAGATGIADVGQGSTAGGPTTSNRPCRKQCRKAKHGHTADQALHASSQSGGGVPCKSDVPCHPVTGLQGCRSRLLG